MGFKLKWRVATVTSIGTLALVFYTYTSLVVSPGGDLPSNYRSENFFKEAGGGHLIAPRMLVDKSSWPTSNNSSPEYQQLPVLRSGVKVCNPSISILVL